MPQNFIESRREQGFLLPPDVRDWLPVDHLAWFVIDAVAQIDLDAFYRAYRADGHGHAAYDPSMMVTLLMYAYATQQRSSRTIERHCHQDVAYRVVTGNLVPDHATIARFVVRHEAALAALFGQVLGLCDRAGLVWPGLVAIDGTRLAGNATPNATRSFEQIAREVLAQAKATDAAEDPEHGAERGDELPEALRTAQGRREFFRQALRDGSRPDTGERDGHLPERDQETEQADDDADGGRVVPEFGFDAERIVARDQGREGWLRDARRQLAQHRCQHPDLITRARADRLILAAERLEQELDAERAGNQAYETYRAHGRMKNGRRFGGPPKPYEPPELPDGKVNVTDPDSKHIKVRVGYVQGYNAQAVVDEGQIVLAAEITNSTVDWSQLDPMLTAAIAELEHAGISGRPELAMADSQYWNEEHMDEVIANEHESGLRETPRPGWTGGRYDWMRHVLSSPPVKALYRKRSAMIEPVFGHTKHNRGVTRFHRRGRSAVRTEWRLLMTTHNLTKFYRHQITTAGL
jgi:transposase